MAGQAGPLIQSDEISTPFALSEAKGLIVKRFGAASALTGLEYLVKGSPGSEYLAQGQRVQAHGEVIGMNTKIVAQGWAPHVTGRRRTNPQRREKHFANVRHAPTDFRLTNPALLHSDGGQGLSNLQTPDCQCEAMKYPPPFALSEAKGLNVKRFGDASALTGLDRLVNV